MMHPWLLHDVRRDDVKARYERAERHRLAAELPAQRFQAPRSLAIMLAGAGLSLASWAAARAEAVRIALARFTE